MNSIDNRKAFIIQKKQELIKKFGLNPLIHSSGKGINSENELPGKIRIIFDPKSVEYFLHETKRK